ncbi:MAG: (d)CMP kinase [Clostridiales bacterium]|nr:(d)CMP kinase [Clostridiales bacterium]
MKEVFRVAIDGPSGAGKSTIAKSVAKRLGIDYIDTGAMYRAVGYKIKEEAIDIRDEKSLKTMLDNTDIDFVSGDIILDGRTVNDKIRTSAISQMASQTSAIPMVREKLVELQRSMGTKKSVIMDGRDIGTNVLKDAEYKFFLTASPEERAERRHKELLEKGENISFEEVLEDIKKRDYNDSTRKLNPLRKADDAISVDTTGLSVEAVIDCVLKEIK